MSLLDMPAPRRRPRVSAVIVGLVAAAASVGVARGVGALIDPDQGEYSFMMSQPLDRSEPVAYDPCSTIGVVVNPDGAPDDWEDQVQTALDHVAGPTGLTFDLEGTTDERPSLTRPLRDPERYGAGWSPVLVSWSDAEEMPGLAGDTVGLGGSQPAKVDGRFWWVTGSITIDRREFVALDADHQQAVLDHELGHVVGLGHVRDPEQLMAQNNYGRTTWGNGDLEGFARLGDVPCPD